MTVLLDGYEGSQTVALSALAGGAIYAASLKLSQLFSPLVTSSYGKLSPKEKVDWDNRAPSTLHAVALTGAAVYLFFLTDLFSEEGSTGQQHAGPVVYRTSLVSDVALGFSVGYFLTDFTFMFNHAHLWQPEMAAHHVAALASVAAAAFRHHAHNYTLALLATECTTPFVNARWMLDKADLRDSGLYLVNGVSLMVVWLLGRIVLFYFFFAHALAHEAEIRTLPWTSLALVVVVPLLLFGLNVFWFNKIVRGALKLVLGSPAEKAHHADEVDASLMEPPTSPKDR